MNKAKVITTKCTACNHPEFLLEYETTIPQPDVDIFVSFLEQSVENGTRFEDGQTIALGSMLILLSTKDNLLVLQEPDMKSFPISWEVGISHTMKLLRLQKDIADSVRLGHDIDPPSIDSSIVVGVDMTDGLDAFVLERMDPDRPYSGWIAGRLDSEINYNEEESLFLLSVYQAILKWPLIAGFLALPVGCHIASSRQSTIISRNGMPLEIQKGSFLDVLRGV